jgi:hypothetical protein
MISEKAGRISKLKALAAGGIAVAEQKPAAFIRQQIAIRKGFTAVRRAEFLLFRLPN